MQVLSPSLISTATRHIKSSRAKNVQFCYHNFQQLWIQYEWFSWSERYHQQLDSLLSLWSIIMIIIECLGKSEMTFLHCGVIFINVFITPIRIVDVVDHSFLFTTIFKCTISTIEENWRKYHHRLRPFKFAFGSGQSRAFDRSQQTLTQAK